MSEQFGGPDRPGPYVGSGAFGTGYGAPAPVRRPTQVLVAVVISLFLGVVTVLLGAILISPAGPDVLREYTKLSDTASLETGATFAGIVVFGCAAIYLVPAIFLLKRKSWARIATIVVAALGIAGGVLSLPGGVLGLGLHITLLVTMLQRPTKDWLFTRR